MWERPTPLSSYLIPPVYGIDSQPSLRRHWQKLPTFYHLDTTCLKY